MAFLIGASVLLPLLLVAAAGDPSGGSAPRGEGDDDRGGRSPSSEGEATDLLVATDANRGGGEGAPVNALLLGLRDKAGLTLLPTPAPTDSRLLGIELSSSVLHVKRVRVVT